MKSTRKKHIYFIYGLIPGIALGITVSFLIFDISFSGDKEFAKQDQSEKIIQEKKPGKIEKSVEPDHGIKKIKLSPEEKEETALKTSSDNINNENLIDSIDHENNADKADTLLPTTIETDSSEEIGESSYPYSIDTSNIEIADEEELINDNQDEEIVVIRDELIDVRSTIIEGMEKYSDRVDSLIMQGNTENDINIYRIELWWSPVNFEGYKLAKNKIILFGVYQYDSLKFISKNDSLLMKYRDRDYFLERDEDFRKLIPLEENE